MVRVKILKHKDISLLERDINEFIAGMESNARSNFKEFKVESVQMLNDSTEPRYTSLIVYSFSY